MIFLDVGTVLDIHRIESEKRDTRPGVRDLSLLESALGRAANHYAYADNPSVASTAAALAFGLAMNHPFIDGNKRTSFIAALVFVDLNGESLNAANDEIVATWLALASGALSEEDLAAWFDRHLQR
jgi:death-on-curing protein